MPPIIGSGGVERRDRRHREAYRRRLADELEQPRRADRWQHRQHVGHADAARQLLVTALAVDQVPEQLRRLLRLRDGRRAGWRDPAGAGRHIRRSDRLAALGPAVQQPAGIRVGGRTDQPVGRGRTSRSGLERVHQRGAGPHLDGRADQRRGNGTYEYSLAAYPWITDSDQIGRLTTQLYFGSNRPADRSPLPFRIVQAGPRGRWSRPTSTRPPTRSTSRAFVRGDPAGVGRLDLGLPDDAGPPERLVPGGGPEDTVVAFAMVKALQAHRRVLLADARMDKQQRRELVAENRRRTLGYARLAARIKREQFPRPIPEPQRGVAIAPSWGGWPNCGRAADLRFRGAAGRWHYLAGPDAGPSRGARTARPSRRPADVLGAIAAYENDLALSSG